MSFACNGTIRNIYASSRTISSRGAVLFSEATTPLTSTALALSRLPHRVVSNSLAYGKSFMNFSATRVQTKKNEGTTIIDIVNQQSCPRNVTSIAEDVSEFLRGLMGGILFVKRTFQPSILRRKRKHGFLARAATRHGQDILNRRRFKKRTNLCG